MKKTTSIIKKVLLVVLLLIVLWVGYILVNYQKTKQEFRKDLTSHHDETVAESTAYDRPEEDEMAAATEKPSEKESPGADSSANRPASGSSGSSIQLGGASSEDAFELETYIDHRKLSHRLYIYDLDYIDIAGMGEKKTLDDFIAVINRNPKIDKQFKPIMIEYCRRLFEKYPGIELRQFYKNLETLEIVECDKRTMMMTTISTDSVGCYVSRENKIYVLEGKEYEEGTWDYQVIFHELSHCMRDSQYTDKDGNQVFIKFLGLNYFSVPCGEALNSLFAVSLLNYEERDIAYQFQSNMHKIIIDCMDNYTLEDYVNHGLSYYVQQLDEYNNDDNYAWTIILLMEEQYKDYHDNKYENEQSTYYPIYDYISEMYLRKHLTPGMSYDDARAVMDEMLEQLLFDVPEKYHVDVDHFYDYLDEYCSEIGIAA